MPLIARGLSFAARSAVLALALSGCLGLGCSGVPHPKEVEPDRPGAPAEVGTLFLDGGNGPPDAGPVSQVVHGVVPGDDLHDHDDRALRALARLYDSHRGRWNSGGWWNWANAVEAAESSYARTNGETHLELIVATFEKNLGAGFLNDYYDDEGWWANAWVRAYDLTGDPRYLTMAKNIFTDLTHAWDSTCGGGLWWSKSRTYKNAITNELFLLLAASLHNRTPGDAGPGSYLEWATKTWRWFDEVKLVNADQLVNDGLTSACANNGGTPWTYNQGVVLGGLVELYKATGETTYLTRAERLADAALIHLVDGAGVLTETCEASGCGADGPSFKGIFVRHLARLYAVIGKPTYRTFLIRNARSVWFKGRGSGAHQDDLGLKWAGPFDATDASRQSSAMFALGALAEPRTRAASFVGASAGPWFNHEVGVPATPAGGWWCDPQACPSQGQMQAGPFFESLPPGPHRAFFTAAIDAVGASTESLLTVGVFDTTASRWLGETSLAARDFQTPGARQSFEVDFENPGGHPLELRVDWLAVPGSPRVSIFDSAIGRMPALSSGALPHGCGSSDGTGGWAVDPWRSPGACEASGGGDLVLEGGRYTAHFELKAEVLPPTPQPFAQVSVFDLTAGAQVGELALNRGHFPNVLYQAVPLAFDALAGHRYAFRTRWLGVAGAPRLTQRAVHVGRELTSVPVTLPFNVRGIGLRPLDGRIDGVGSVFAASYLPASLSLFPATFSWGSFGAGANNVLEGNGVEVATLPGHYLELQLVGFAVGGTQSAAPLVIHYGDGTTQTASVSFSDWVTEALQPGEEVALAAPARWSSAGIEHGNFRVYRHTVRLETAKTMVGFQLPTNANLKVLAATLLR